MKRKKFYTSILFFTLTLSVLALNGCSKSTDTFFEESSDTKESSGTEESLPLSANYTVTLSKENSGQSISDTLYGLFIEDINFAVDGGLYAEMVKNRSFEYGTAAANENRHGWVNDFPDYVTFEIADGTAGGKALNENNPHYAIISYNGLSSAETYYGIGNVGYLDGLSITENENYNVSLYLKTALPEDLPENSAISSSLTNYSGSVRISLRDAEGNIYSQTMVDHIDTSWKKYEAVLTSNATVNKNLRLYVEISAGTVCVDMVSLMPEDTYKGLPIRRDIGEHMEALAPTFLRFPGGCVIEGRDEESIYRWKDSIGNGLTFTVNGEKTTGDAAARPQGKDIWQGSKQHPYYTTYGIGFYEYFQLCEALDCLPVPVLNAGMTCQVQSPKYIVYPLTSDEFKQYVQDALDLVEFCLGDENTYWGGIRTAMGHAEPFALKYIAIGNEQWQSEYHAHYEMFVEAFEAAASENPALYGDIELIVANGTASGSTEGWSYLEDYPDSITTLVDEHYYEAPSWFFTNTKRYDAYDRTTQASVFLGEYAAQSNTLNAALAEAAYMTGLERNSDIVTMACYAPLFGNSTTNQWTPDMMFFSNNSLCKTPNYYVQQMFAGNVGTTLLPSSVAVTGDTKQSGLSGGVGLGSWMTFVSYDNLTVTSNSDGRLLYGTDFEDEATLKKEGFNDYEGEWYVEDGTLIQKNTDSPADGNTGDAIYIGDESWSDYTLTVDASILGGSEGFLIPVCVQNPQNQIFWNLGGWGNTVSCLQIVSGNAKSGQITGTVKNISLKKNQTYQLKVVVTGDNIKCYLDDTLYIDYTQEAAESLYETASVDENGDLILKLVNASAETIPTAISLQNADMSLYETEASLTVLAGNDLSATNTFDAPDNLVPMETTLEVSESFVYEVPAYSVNILRIKKK